ncbi:MAG: hypothetical protein EOM50_00800 [Erysipelotrichia bacterium]|nr:hypothetical protein [Erysipelotrichia bacterium]
MKQEKSELPFIDAKKINYLFYDAQSKQTKIKMCDQTQFIFNMRIKKVLELLCLRYGSTMQGRIEFFAYTLHIHQKVPLLVSERHELLLFSLYGMRHKEAMWIAYHQVKKVNNQKNLTTLLHFKNNEIIHVKINYRSIKRQMQRCKQMIQWLNAL